MRQKCSNQMKSNIYLYSPYSHITINLIELYNLYKVQQGVTKHMHHIIFMIEKNKRRGESMLKVFI